MLKIRRCNYKFSVSSERCVPVTQQQVKMTKLLLTSHSRSDKFPFFLILCRQVTVIHTHPETFIHEIHDWNVNSFISLKLNKTFSRLFFLYSSVSADVGGPHRGRVVFPDAGQHNNQRLHRSNAQGLERRDGRMYPHPLRAYLNCALHAPTWEKVGWKVNFRISEKPVEVCVTI